MTIDIARARAETPGTRHVVHLNNAGAALPPQPVLDAVTAHLALEATIGGYEAAEHANERLEGVYDSVARLLACSRDEVALTESATAAWGMAFNALAALPGEGFRPGDRILTARAEYAANLIPFLQASRRTGVAVEVIPSDGTGQTSVAALEAMIAEPGKGPVRLIAITHIPTNGGLVNPAAAIGRVARRHGIPYLLDACQTVGQMPVDVEDLGCDFLSATGRKFLRAPRGTGFLYVRKEWLDRIEPYTLDHSGGALAGPDRYTMRPDARRFELWESNIAARLGLGVAVDYALSWGLEAIRDRAFALADRLRHGLGALPGVTVRDLGAERCAIVTFTVDGREPRAIKAALRGQGINLSVSSAPSTPFDMDARGLTEVVRASPHYYNDEAEVERLLAAVTAL
ncbi:aminotransferase class V-fold PLP-dependent enzyme [Azospirillum sp. YIM DDC1]|uniref:Aminotransferase class V-fold PLP-dependent enzyme n=1 Tax=Azospirillum aestuarii TaxID=2802052 RepID=A0ABS1HTV1_9PROT|nr:aminotransferase class V-fold PLP-dependent enzyme [Azospirillum aestuarii]MBK3775130.1 aminotransferase class V-fold PLP-dependent enzyme [Azospirillum brasilense]MBK4718258.1 aminotransferase class V-fold PLP-dependent enzyme [Azospirillum aestuarii]